MTAGVRTLRLNQGSCLGLAPRGEAGREVKSELSGTALGTQEALGKKKKIFFFEQEDRLANTQILYAQFPSPCPQAFLGATFPKAPQSPEARACRSRLLRGPLATSHEGSESEGCARCWAPR